MRELAREVGVSAMSVSRALRGDPKCGPELRVRIQQVAQRLGYRPSPFVSALLTQVRRRRTSGYEATIAILDAGRRAGDYRRSATLRGFVDGARTQAERAGFHVDEFHAGANLRQLAAVLRQIRARGIPGLLLPPFPRAHTRIEVDLSGLALATIGRSLEYPVLHKASSDHFHGATLALRQLQASGARRIGLILDTANHERTERLWHAAYLAYCAHEAPGSARAIPALFIDWSPEDWEGRRRHFQSILDWCRRHRVDGVVSLHAWLLEPLQGAGIDPERYADLDYSQDKGLTQGVDQQPEVIGAAAMDLVTAQVLRNESGSPVNPKTLLIKGVWR